MSKSTELLERVYKVDEENFVSGTTGHFKYPIEVWKGKELMWQVWGLKDSLKLPYNIRQMVNTYYSETTRRMERGGASRTEPL